MLNPETGPEQSQEINESELKAYELKQMQEKAPKGDFDVSKDSPVVFRACLTPTEHKLIGSTLPGIVFHPNLPLAAVKGVSAGEINQARERSNEHEDWRFFAKAENGEFYQVVIKLSPIKAEQLEKEEPAYTFEVVEEQDIKGAAIDKNNEEILKDLSNIVEKAREDGRVSLEERINLTNSQSQH